jgi:hypothetical protein
LLEFYHPKAPLNINEYLTLKAMKARGYLVMQNMRDAAIT